MTKIGVLGFMTARGIVFFACLTAVVLTAFALREQSHTHEVAHE